ncbi:hypothetical protein D8674_034017 [Pyrus ussuriensis x Pyrus communis]|uniref:DUF8040 domain-containing protein n=1 Tax=Pyrus ussuriensis x Pyrus communis TaxID=2448454 RepID=A0A5N5HSU1_9ROSA|nr:hypothetical protein D8674_034017 [Pyrus ussuriensis x Pyrus communis]
MENTDVVDMVTRLKRKCAINEEENRKKRKIIVGTIIYVIVIVMHWYSKSVLLKEPSNDWDQERQSFLGRLFNGKDSTCIEQLRVSKSAFKRFCEILQGIGGLVRTRHVSIEESVAIFLHILAHNLKFRVVGFHYYCSKETISRQFHNVLHAMMKISQEYVKYQPCIIGNSEREKWRWFEVILKCIIRIINACCILHNFIRTEQAADPVLEAQDLQFLAYVDSELLNRSTREENENNSDRITSVQATAEWTSFRDTLALHMFHDYQAQRVANTS